MNKHNDALITASELAKWLNVSPFTLYRSYKTLGIPSVQVGGSLRFRVGAVREWVSSRESSGDAQ